MARLKSHPLFTVTIAVLLAVAVGAGVLLYLSLGKASAAARSVKQKSQTLSGYTQRSPFPSEDNVKAAEAELAKAQELLTTMQSALKGRGEFAQRVQNSVHPDDSTKAYFDLANFVESMRLVAQEANVALPADTRFGFQTYVRTGPDKNLIPQVHRQRLVAEYLLKTLFKATPQELVSLQRNRPTAPGSAAATGQISTTSQRSNSTNSASPENDFFDIDSRMTAAVPGFVESAAFKLTFIGYSDSLREFLNQIATFELPLVVRSVEVEQVAVKNESASRRRQSASADSLTSLFGGAPTSGGTATEEEDSKPIVEQVRSKFTVTIEYITLVEKRSDETEENN